jgi:hypothetical protein
MPRAIDAEKRRIEESRKGTKNWRRWGPYLSERQWGTVREDYSPGGTAWDYLSHDQARSRAYRWGEDGIAGFSDDRQLLCLSIALWNGRDPILKERLFGLTNGEGSHGEDVKELYYYLDAVPSYAYARMLYKLPQAAYPYQWLIDENARRRGSAAMEFELIDTGIFDGDRYFDVEVEYAKADVDDVLMRVTVHNRGPENASIHILPQAWFRNIWSWSADAEKPSLKDQGDGNVIAKHAQLGEFRIHFERADRLLFCDNETNFHRLFGLSAAPGHFKDAFHEYVVHDNAEAVNAAGEGTKVAGLYLREIPAGGSTTIRVRLSAGEKRPSGFDGFDDVFTRRVAQANVFYAALQRSIVDEDMRRIQRQAFAGMLWNKQFYDFNVQHWLDGDPGQPPPPENRKHGRNSDWRHFIVADIISMPDKWEYPWFAAWDLAFHCVTLSLIDPDFSKEQLLLLCEVWLMHPNGELPAYEWAFGDVNPPVHAWAAMRVFENDRDQSGTADLAFLARVFHKLLLNFTWWVNRKDPQGLNIFEGGFLGLDNIGVFDRSRPLPTGGSIEQSDGTAWMAMFCLNMFRMSIELSRRDPVYEDMAIKFLEHFLYIARAMTDMGKQGIGLWDDADNFFYDVLSMPSGHKIPMRLRSMVGLIPLFAVGVIEQDVIDKHPRLWANIERYRRQRPDLVALVSRWNEEGVEGRRLFALARVFRMTKILRRLLDETEFLSPYGVRALSRSYLDNPYDFEYQGIHYGVKYLPGESDGGLFGGNSNWRGPIWMPVNYLLIENLRRFHQFYGDRLKVECPTGSGTMLTLDEIADELCRRLINIFRRDADGRRPVFGGYGKFQRDPNFKDYILFHEYFHGDNGRGCGASHQTGWTGLVVNLIDQLAAEQRIANVPAARTEQDELATVSHESRDD